MRARVSAARFAAFVRGVEDVLDAADFRFDAEGLLVQAMDTSHVSLVAARFPAGAWDGYACPRAVCAGFNLKSLKTLLRTAARDDVLTLEAEDVTPASVSFAFSDSAGSAWEVELQCVTIDGDTLCVPPTAADATWAPDSAARYVELVSRFDAVGAGAARFAFREDGAMETTGRGAELRGTLVTADGVTVRRATKDAASYSVPLLKRFAKGAGLGAGRPVRCVVESAEGQPLVVRFESGAAPIPAEFGCESVRYYLAPQVAE